MTQAISDKISSAVRCVPDFPKAGINFFDITTILKNPSLLREVIGELGASVQKEEISAVIGIEARGFILGAAVAADLGVGFVPVRKPGKLPAAVERVEYDLEYGSDAIEIHRDSLSVGDRVLIVDDLLATGGTAAATVDLVNKLGAEVHSCAFLIELGFLNGREKFDNTAVHSLMIAESE